MNRARDWWVQAQADLRHARHALEDGDYKWACFAAIRRKSFGSVVVYSVDRVAVEEALDRFVTACREREEVLAVVLFGSFARGGFGVGSDVDLLLILRESPLPFPDRIPLYRPVDFPIDVDVLPYTLAEIRAGQPLAEEALRTGRILWRREGVDEKTFSSTEDPSTVHDASS